MSGACCPPGCTGGTHHLWTRPNCARPLLRIGGPYPRGIWTTWCCRCPEEWLHCFRVMVITLSTDQFLSKLDPSRLMFSPSHSVVTVVVYCCLLLSVMLLSVDMLTLFLFSVLVDIKIWTDVFLLLLVMLLLLRGLKLYQLFHLLECFTPRSFEGSRLSGQAPLSYGQWLRKSGTIKADQKNQRGARRSRAHWLLTRPRLSCLW